MRKINVALAFLFLAIFAGCENISKVKVSSSSDTGKSTKSKIRKTVFSQKAIDSMLKSGAINEDDIDVPPTQAEEKKALEGKYQVVKIIDTIFSNGNDTTHFYSRYYCLKNVKIVVPKTYDLSEAPMEFQTHPFVLDVWMTNKGDTVLKKQFNSSVFHPFFDDKFGGALKKYGTIIDVAVSEIDKKRGEIVLACSIAIPVTDIGKGLNLSIDSKGKWRIN